MLAGDVDTLTYRAFSMHYLDKQTVSQIAAELNLTQRMVRRRLGKARRRFADLCQQDIDKDLLTGG